MKIKHSKFFLLLSYVAIVIPCATGQMLCINCHVDSYEVGDIYSDCCCHIQDKSGKHGLSYERPTIAAIQQAEPYVCCKDYCPCIDVPLDNSKPRYSPKRADQDFSPLSSHANTTIDVFQPKGNIADYNLSTALPKDTIGLNTIFLLI